MISTAITSLLIVLIFCFGHVSTRQELHNRVVNSNIKTKKLFILIIGYDKLYNKQIWEYFFHKVDAALYRIFFHSKFPNTLEHSRHFQITVIDPVPNGYCKVSIVMNALLEAALKESNNDDCFVFLSADSIPVKPFKHIYEYLCGPIGTSVASKLCITPTSQWFSYESALYPKSHQWMSLNKTDAQNSVALSRASSTQSNPYAPLPSLESWCMEEVWHSFALYGAYNSSTSKLNELIYPSENEQGTCIMYVWWPNYVRDKSPFLSSDIVQLTERETHGSQMIIITPMELLFSLKKSPNFMFARKFRSDLPGHIVEAENKTRSVPLAVAVDHYRFYD